MWWGDEEAMVKILAYPVCDAGIKTKDGTERTPLVLVEKLGDGRNRKSLLTLLQASLEKDKFPTYVTAKDGEKMKREGPPLLIHALASYKNTFHPHHIDPSGPFQQLMMVSTKEGSTVFES